MAGASLLSLIDDIAGVLDDVSVMTKIAAKKTAGVLGDDLALNAEQVAGVNADRELPVVWAVAKGSGLNKLILVPVALALSAFLPWVVTPLLILGGLFLCFEGAEKLWHAARHRGSPIHQTPAQPDGGTEGETPAVAQATETEKIKGAIRTDFVLSAEIVTITLGTVADAPMMQRLTVLALVAVAMTVGVYGFVALLVKLDDIGLHLVNTATGPGARRALGRGLLAAAPRLMRFLSVAGTIAMFMVGGGILSHGIPTLHHWVEHLVAALGSVAVVASSVVDAGLGLVAGGLLVAVVEAVRRVRGLPAA